MFYLAEDLPVELPGELNLNEVENKTFVEELISSFDWRSIAQQATLAAFRIIITLFVFFVANIIAKWAIETLFRKIVGARNADGNRFETIYRVVKNVYHTIFYFFLIYTILEILNFPVETLLASAGIVGLSISFGAQGFVSDLVNGFTILSGRQLSIGDEVRIEDILGTVVDINLRTTEIKDFDGTIHYIPNREILIISNRSKGDMRARIEVRLFPETDTDRVRQIITQVNDSMVPKISDITVPPTEVTFVSNHKNQLTMRVTMYTKPGSQYGVSNSFYEEYVNALIEEGIELPFSDIDFDKK